MQKSLKLLILSIALVSLLGAQDKPADNKAATEKEIDGTYLDRYHAKNRAHELQTRNRDDIYRLNIMVANFGSGEDKSAYDKIQKDYKEGIKFLYRNKHLNAERTLETNRTEIVKLYSSLADKYRARNNELLGKCADGLVELELSTGGDPNKVSGAARVIAAIKVRLVVAYTQQSMGEAFHTDRPADAINHYRVARFHAVEMMAALVPDDAGKDKVRKDYELDLADAENRILQARK